MGNEVIDKCDVITSMILMVLAFTGLLILIVICKEMCRFLIIYL